MAKSVEEYLNGNIWEEELRIIREVILKYDLEETVKWGMPAYLIEGKNIIGVCSFKKYFGIWFHQGVFLKDEAGVLINAQEGKTIGLRQWRFTDKREIKKKVLEAYVKEAIKNSLDGLEIHPKRTKKKLVVPDELKAELKTNKKFKAAYETLTHGRKREVCDYIGGAKREATRLNRVEKVVPLVLVGKTPNDKYKKK